ncbi:hypothetical protein [Pseudomonas sp. N-137]
MSEHSISLTRFNEAHIGGGTALYNDPAVARQMLLRNRRPAARLRRA